MNKVPDLSRPLVGDSTNEVEDVHYLLVMCPNCDLQIELDSTDINKTHAVICENCHLEIIINWSNMEYWAYKDTVMEE